MSGKGCQMQYNRDKRCLLNVDSYIHISTDKAQSKGSRLIAVEICLPWSTGLTVIPRGAGVILLISHHRPTLDRPRHKAPHKVPPLIVSS